METPTPFDPYGMKGTGEGGAAGVHCWHASGLRVSRKKVGVQPVTGRIDRYREVFVAVRGSGPQVMTRLDTVRAAPGQASRVIIRHAPITDQPTVQPTITEIIARVGIRGMPRTPCLPTAPGRGRRRPSSLTPARPRATGPSRRR